MNASGHAMAWERAALQAWQAAAISAVMSAGLR
jgi:hypothetical protein